MASTLVACSGGSSSNAKTLTVSVNQSLTGQFTPQYASSAYDQYVVNLCYESMLKYNADNELVPELAKDLPYDFWVVLVGDTITEEALPTYESWLMEVEGVVNGDSETRNGWSKWIRQ